MAYYPKSQIKTNLYTSGGEFVISSTQEIYKGPYYQVSNGNKYTGKTPKDGPNNLLTPQSQYSIEEIGIDGVFPIKEIVILNTPYEYYPEIPDFNIQYQNSNNNINRNLPLPNPTIPTQKDYDLGVFQRYFCKKNNELIYIEIDKTTFQQLNSNSNKIAWDLYSALSLNWYLTGDKSKVYNANKGLSTLIETKEKWHGFTQYFKDKYLKYYLES